MPLDLALIQEFENYAYRQGWQMEAHVNYKGEIWNTYHNFKYSSRPLLEMWACPGLDIKFRKSPVLVYSQANAPGQFEIWSGEIQTTADFDKMQQIVDEFARSVNQV